MLQTSKINSEKLANLIREARGTTSNQEFASLIGVSPSYISRLINNKSGNLPSRDLLIKIAAITPNNITLDQLLEAAGYHSLNNIEVLDVPNGDTKSILATILTALNDFPIAWSNGIVSKPFDLSISFQKGTIKNWHFLYLNYANSATQTAQLKLKYFDLIFTFLEPDDKISFVTSYPAEYELYHSKLPKNLDLNLSIILIDEKKLSVQKEEWLHTKTLLSPEALTSYVLI